MVEGPDAVAERGQVAGGAAPGPVRESGNGAGIDGGAVRSRDDDETVADAGAAGSESLRIAARRFFAAIARGDDDDDAGLGRAAHSRPDRLPGRLAAERDVDDARAVRACHIDPARDGAVGMHAAVLPAAIVR